MEDFLDCGGGCRPIFRLPASNEADHRAECRHLEASLAIAEDKASSSRAAELEDALRACLERLKLVDTDSESRGFVESCQPIIAMAEAVLAKTVQTPYRPPVQEGRC